jgi:hypothetical protein
MSFCDGSYVIRTKCTKLSHNGEVVFDSLFVHPSVSPRITCPNLENDVD